MLRPSSRYVGWVERGPTKNRAQKVAFKLIEKPKTTKNRVKPNALLRR